MTGAAASWRPSLVTDHREDPEGPEHGKRVDHPHPGRAVRARLDGADGRLSAEARPLRRGTQEDLRPTEDSQPATWVLGEAGCGAEDPAHITPEAAREGSDGHP